MDRSWRLGKNKSSTDTIGGSRHILKENIPNLVSPTVVARLMGLDGLPYQPSFCEEEKNLVDNNIHKAAVIVSERTAHLGLARKKIYVEQTEFKDVFEDAINKSASNKDLKPEILQQPNSSVIKNLRGRRVQADPSNSVYKHITILKPSKSAKDESKAKRQKMKGQDLQKNARTRQHDNLRHSNGSHISQSSPKLLNVHTHRKDKSDIISRRLVILKPNYAKPLDALNSFTLPGSLHANMSDRWNHKEYNTSTWMREEEYFGKRDSSKDVGLLKPKFREAVKKGRRERSEIFGHVMEGKKARKPAKVYNKEILDVTGTDFPSSVRPVAGDLYDFCDMKFASEPVVTSNDSAESFLSREANRRLLERWNMVQRSQDVRVGGKGSTLGEMMAIAEVKLGNLDAVMGVEEMRDGVLGDKNEMANGKYPLGGSSRDGGKGSYSRFSPSPKLLCPPSTSNRNQKLNAKCKTRVDDKLLMPKKAIYRGRCKETNKKSDGKEDFSLKTPETVKQQSQSSRRRYACSTNSLLESYPIQDHVEENLEKKYPSEQQPVVLYTPNSLDRAVEVATVIVNDLNPALLTCVLKSGDSCAGAPEDFNKQESSIEPSERDTTVQHTRAAPQSPQLKGVDHPSPVSVLEVPSGEDDVLSGHECFEQISADLQELQNQLQLLKRQSNAYTGAPMLVKSDYGVSQGLPSPVEDKEMVKSQCWESSYIADVLNELGFKRYNDPDLLITTWYSSDSPLGPWVFDNLENKYYDGINKCKHERRLLFDRINSALAEISESYMDRCPWVRSTRSRFHMKWQKREVRVELRKMLAVQENEANYDISGGKLLDKEMNWLNSRDTINTIGREIETLLINELLTEFVATM